MGTVLTNSSTKTPKTAIQKEDVCGYKLKLQALSAQCPITIVQKMMARICGEDSNRVLNALQSWIV